MKKIKIKTQIWKESVCEQQAAAPFNNILVYRRVNNKFLTVLTIILAIAVVVFISSCNSPEEKVDKTEVDLLKAEQDLDKANAKYLENVENYRFETRNKIQANNQQIAQLKRQIDNKKKDVKVAYNKQIATLEQKNKEMERRISDYKADSKDSWETFKADFNEEMDKLGTALNNFFTNS